VSDWLPSRVVLTTLAKCYKSYTRALKSRGDQRGICNSLFTSFLALLQSGEQTCVAAISAVELETALGKPR
jgi:hypothetical protein